MDLVKTNAMYPMMLEAGYTPELPSPCPLGGDVDPRKIVIQRRHDNTVSFIRTWTEYEEGFGDPIGNMWLGLKYIHALCNHESPCILYVQLYHSVESKQAWYDNFYLMDRSHNYELRVDEYRGSAGDSLAYHNGSEFSTFDNDNDSDPSNCAEVHKGGWWYNACHESNLNGIYYGETQITSNDAITWNGFMGSDFTYSHVNMKVWKP